MQVLQPADLEKVLLDEKNRKPKLKDRQPIRLQVSYMNTDPWALRQKRD